MTARRTTLCGKFAYSTLPQSAVRRRLRDLCFPSPWAMVNLNQYPPLTTREEDALMRYLSIFLSLFAFASIARGQTIDVEAQPLADNVSRVLRALDELGNPLPADQVTALTRAAKAQDVKKLQQLL